MAEPQSDEKVVNKSEEYQPEATKHLTVTLPGPDESILASAILELDEDATKQPRLAKIIKHSEAEEVAPEYRETHVILSVGSGHQKAADFYHECVGPLLAALYPDHQNLHVHTTASATSVLELANNVFFPKADAGTALRIILLSGDGGIVDLVNGLSSRATSASYVAPQAILMPLGTANALYHSINAGKANTWGLAALSSAQSRPLPIFTASFSPGARLLVDEARSEEELSTDRSSGRPTLHGAVVCSWGMHASLVADSDTAEYRKFGVERFQMAAKEALYPADGSAPHAYKANVSVLKGDTWTPLDEKEHMYTLATMVSNLEQPFCISPHSKPLDGSIHLVHFGPTSGDEAMRLMGLAYQGGKHVDEPAIRYEAIDGLRIEFQGREEEGRWRRICVDGKIVRVEKDGWVELRRDVRRVLDVVV